MSVSVSRGLSLPNLLIDGALKQMPASQRLLGRMMQLNEGHAGLAHTKFIQDTLMVWIPKALISRSKAELNESTVLEFAESGLVYYGLAGLGQHLFQHVMHKLAPRFFDKRLLSRPLGPMVLNSPALQRLVLPAKAATIIASLGTAAIAGEYVLNFAKNLMTEKVFRKTQFSEVANLSATEWKEKDNLSPTGQKALRRIKQCLAVTAGLLGGSMLLTRFGPASKTLGRLLAPFVKTFDFSFANGKFGLSRPQLYTFMAIAFGAYLDSSRDKLERVEVATRLGIVLSFLAFGSELIQKGLIALVGKKYPDVLTPDRQIKTLEGVMKTVLQKQAAQGGSVLQHLTPIFKGKALLTFLPILISILLPGIALGLLNRYWTAYRFKQDQALKHSNQNLPGPTAFSSTYKPQLTTNPFLSPYFQNSPQRLRFYQV